MGFCSCVGGLLLATSQEALINLLQSASCFSSIHSRLNLATAQDTISSRSSLCVSQKADHLRPPQQKFLHPHPAPQSWMLPALGPQTDLKKTYSELTNPKWGPQGQRSEPEKGEHPTQALPPTRAVRLIIF